MKVSFVIPVYKKKPEQLRRCLKSLFDQSYKDIEVIAVFDGADATLEAVAQEFKDARYVVIEHAGAPKARNAGLAIATGDVVSCWDADCYAEPEMTSVWVERFKADPALDFVYSGYKWTNPNVPGFPSEPFDPWLIHKYNYIASMFPIKRDKCPQWDESLTGLQDWDFWRRVIQAGCKGEFIEGYGFSTDLPDNDSISGKRDTTKERILKIREKHKDLDSPILVHGTTYRDEAVRIAKVLDADYFWNDFWKIKDYRLVLVVGFNPDDIARAGYTFAGDNRGTKRGIFWMGLDAEQMSYGPYTEVKKCVKAIQDTVHFHWCEDLHTQAMLEDLGIKAEIMPLPRKPGDPATVLPTKFKVLALADNHYAQAVDSVIRAMPFVEFEKVAEKKAYNLLNYSLILQFTRSPSLIRDVKGAIMQGRYVLSNVQAPYAGYVECVDDVVKFKTEMVARINGLRNITELNKEAQEYYLNLTDPETFKRNIYATIEPVKLEVV